MTEPFTEEDFIKTTDRKGFPWSVSARGDVIRLASYSDNGAGDSPFESAVWKCVWWDEEADAWREIKSDD